MVCVESECSPWRARSRGVEWLLPCCPMWPSARRGQRGTVCGPATLGGSRSLMCAKHYERNNEFLPVSERPFRALLYHRMGEPESLASSKNWAWLQRRSTPECTVLQSFSVRGQLSSWAGYSSIPSPNPFGRPSPSCSAQGSLPAAF